MYIPIVEKFFKSKITNDYVEAYRKYYRGDKIRFARWSKGREKPLWMKPLN